MGLQLLQVLGCEGAAARQQDTLKAVFDGFGYIGKLGFGVWAGSDVPLVDDNPTMFVDADTGKWRVGEMEWQTRFTRVDEVL